METRLSTGIEGLDRMLNGGLLPGRAYLVKGAPGTGKTTLAMHFAMAGVSRGESVMYITLEESGETLRIDMMRLGFNLNDPHLTIIDATPIGDNYVFMDTFFDSFAKGFDKMVSAIKDELRTRRYTRIVIDPITMVKLTSTDEIEYRRLFLSFLKSMHKRGITLVMTSEVEKTDVEEYLVSGIIELKSFDLEGELVRGIRITKLRGSGFDTALRPYVISDGGIVVFTDKILKIPAPCKT
ncbi:ATPase domain-containing protein [Thermococcus sp.]|uniref:RAD55 family ATPase n=1 Tax=Thermococcus sp. TaxID=35749 RepID=UPI002605BDAD|nr:ATPase domain-containing protein [Thermococcus sp.]